MIDKKLIYNDLHALRSLCEKSPFHLKLIRSRNPEEWEDVLLQKFGKNIIEVCSKHPYGCSNCPLYNCKCFRDFPPTSWTLTKDLVF